MRDFGSASASIIVNRSFVTEVIGDSNALGRRVRYASGGNARSRVDAATRYEIVGVMEDFLADEGPMMYHPMTKAVHPINVTVRTSSGISAAAAQLRAVASRVDSRLHLGRLRSMREIYSERRAADQMFGVVLGSVMVIVFLFSIAGMYTLMAFVIAHRWREVGLRSALGARPLRLVGGIFGRAFIPLLVGAIAGCVLGVLIHSSLPIEEAGGLRIPGVIPITAVVMVVAGLLAVAGPARRALRVNPTDALRVG
jgi:ABC-type antimicrobial peptide transport system permease subunit